jgi:Fic family protein
MPCHLPNQLPVSGEMLRLISEVDRYLGQWSVMRQLAPERLASLRRIATIESVGSSTRIEGSRLSDAEVIELLGRLETQAFRTRDEEEVAGYAYVMELVFSGCTSFSAASSVRRSGSTSGLPLKPAPRRCFRRWLPNWPPCSKRTTP